MLHTTHKLFPRVICEGSIDEALLSELQAKVVFEEDRDWSASLAGELEQQVAWPLNKPAAAKLREVLTTSCYDWIKEAKKSWIGGDEWDRWSYEISVSELWLNKQIAGDYNPLHAHAQDFSGVLYLEVPEGMIPHDGWIQFTGPDVLCPRNFQFGLMAGFEPKPGQYFVFPAWQPHSVNPFRCEGERVSVAFNARLKPQEGWNEPPPVENTRGKGFG